MFVPVDISSTITSYSNKFWVVFSKTKKSSVHIGCMIGFFVLLRLSVISVALHIYILFISQWVWLGCCGPTLHAKERKEGKKGKFLSYKKKDTLGWLIDLPFLFPISFTPSLNPFLPLSLSSRLLMSLLPTDPPPGTVSQGSLRPSLALLGRRFLLRPRRTRHILLQAVQEKEKRTVTRYEWNQICLTCLAATAIFHADREYQDWVNGMQ